MTVVGHPRTRGVSFECAYLLRARGPEPDDAIFATRCKKIGIESKSDRPHWLRGSQHAPFYTNDRIPKTYVAVSASRGQRLSIGRELNALKGAGMATQRPGTACGMQCHERGFAIFEARRE